jgi:hypothetical protein
MSLTEEGYRERKWGHFPALRKVLESKSVPAKYYGPLSDSDNLFDAMERLIEIAVLTVEYGSDIQEAAISVGRNEMRVDLKRLEKSLEEASYFIKRRIEEVGKLYHTI